MKINNNLYTNENNGIASRTVTHMATGGIVEYRQMALSFLEEGTKNTCASMYQDISMICYAGSSPGTSGG